MILLLLLGALQLGTRDTLQFRAISAGTLSKIPEDSGRLGPAQVQLRTGQGTVQVWLFTSRDSVFLAASIPDTTPYWGDDFVISLDTRGDAASSPQEDDFQWYFRRSIDSSVVYRGRDGRWEAPRADPDWRLGRERGGGGWLVESRGSGRGWNLLLRLDRAWFVGENGRLPRLAFRVYDDRPAGWFSVPGAGQSEPGTVVEQTPSRWIPIRAAPR